MRGPLPVQPVWPCARGLVASRGETSVRTERSDHESALHRASVRDDVCGSSAGKSSRVPERGGGNNAGEGSLQPAQYRRRGRLQLRSTRIGRLTPMRLFSCGSAMCLTICPDDARRRLRKIADHRARVCTPSVMHTSKNRVPWRSFPLGLVGQLPQRLVLRALRVFLQEGFHGNEGRPSSRLSIRPMDDDLSPRGGIKS